MLVIVHHSKSMGYRHTEEREPQEAASSPEWLEMVNALISGGGAKKSAGKSLGSKFIISLDISKGKVSGIMVLREKRSMALS